MGGPSGDQKKAAVGAEQAQMNLSNQSAAQSAQTYATTFPGMQTAENYYAKIASGDPQAMFSAIAPSAQAISASTAAAKNSIQNFLPSGGEKNLALAQADISGSSQLGNLEAQSYAGSFPALAQLAGQGIGLSANEVANAISGAAGAGQTATNVMGDQAQAKGATMGFLGDLAGAGGKAATAGKGGGSSGCYIAALVFGEDFDTGPRVSLCRLWLGKDFAPSGWLPRVIVGMYSRYGERAVAVIKHSSLLTVAFRRLFDVVLAKAEAKYGKTGSR